MGLTAIHLGGLIAETLIDLGFLALLLQIGLGEAKRLAARFRRDCAGTLAGIVALDLPEIGPSKSPSYFAGDRYRSLVRC